MTDALVSLPPLDASADLRAWADQLLGDSGTTASPASAVVLDEDGLLRRGDRWVAISDAQMPVVRLLLDHLDRVVDFETLVSAYAAAGGSSHRASVRTVMARLDARVAPLELEVVSVRRRGVALRSQRTPTA